MENNFLDKAKQWLSHTNGANFLDDQEYCPTRDIFQARLEKFRLEAEKIGFSNTPLLVAILGEIGNNAFDHNLGNWRDIPGIYFDTKKDALSAIIADRGQGVRKTISRIRPEIPSDTEALKVAFTEIISGRSPEQRGNGLKFVRQIIESQKWNLTFLSGDGIVQTKSNGEIEFSKNDENIVGCIAFIRTINGV